MRGYTGETCAGYIVLSAMVKDRCRSTSTSCPFLFKLFKVVEKYIAFHLIAFLYRKQLERKQHRNKDVIAKSSKLSFDTEDLIGNL